METKGLWLSRPHKQYIRIPSKYLDKIAEMDDGKQIAVVIDDEFL